MEAEAINLSSVQQKLIVWARDCSYAIGDQFDATIATLKDTFSEKGTPVHEYEPLLRQLIISCHLSSESVFLLVSHCKLWDAEAILRSVVEGTFKMVYLCVGNKEDIKAKFSEFAGDLSEINSLKRHKRLSEFLAHAPDADSYLWKPFRDLLLSDEELQRLETSHPKAKRRILEQRWSFHSIINCLSQAEAELKWLAEFRHLFFQYGMASHVLHQDADGIAVVFERSQRDEKRREAVELAHAARILGDLSVMAFLRHLAALHLCGKDLQPAIDHYKKQEQLHNEHANATAYWHDVEYRNQ